MCWVYYQTFPQLHSRQCGGAEFVPRLLGYIAPLLNTVNYLTVLVWGVTEIISVYVTIHPPFRGGLTDRTILGCCLAKGRRKLHRKK
ncbi:hypothetical protein BJX76DRAFT_241313 [Aspergillus varians]